VVDTGVANGCASDTQLNVDSVSLNILGTGLALDDDCRGFISGNVSSLLLVPVLNK
jgi:hypothetical protein